MANPRGTWTLFKRETQRFMKVWMQTIMAPVISNVLYLAIFGISLKRVIPMEGIGYLEFLVPGLIIMGMINNAFQNPSSSIVIMKYQRLIENLMTIPLRKGEIMLAFMGSAVVRAFIVGIMTLLASLIFVSFEYKSITIIFIGGMLVSLFFSFLGMIVGIWVDEFDKVAFVQNFILMPLIFLGGVFYPVTSLPPLFQTISGLNPIVYMINLLRYGFTGVQEFSITLSFTIVGTGVLIFGLIAYSLLRSGWKLQN